MYKIGNRGLIFRIRSTNAQPLHIGMTGQELSFDFRDLAVAALDSCGLLLPLSCDLLDRSTVSVKRCLLPPIVPIKEDEVQYIALPNDRRHGHGSNRALPGRATVPSLHHDDEADAAPIPAAEPTDSPAIDDLPAKYKSACVLFVCCKPHRGD